MSISFSSSSPLLRAESRASNIDKVEKIGVNSRSRSSDELRTSESSPKAFRKIRMKAVRHEKAHSAADQFFKKGMQFYSGSSSASPNLSVAAYLFTQAANLDHARAQHLLGAMFDRGNGVVKSREKAIFWLSKAAAQNYIPSKNYLKIFHETYK